MIFSRKKDQKRIFIFGKFFTIRKLSQIDFIEDGGIPISLFSLVGTGGRDASKTIFSAVKTEDEKKKELEIQRELVKKILKMGIVKPTEFKTSDVGWDQAFMLYALILDFSLCRFKKIFEIQKNTVLLLDSIAKRYGITPIQLVASRETFSDLESFMFNSFIGINALTHEIEMHNKTIEEQKKAMRGK